MNVHEQTKIHIELASAPNNLTETPEEEATFLRCDQHGMFMDYGILALNEGEKIWSASGALREHKDGDYYGRKSHTLLKHV